MCCQVGRMVSSSPDRRRRQWLGHAPTRIIVVIMIIKGCRCGAKWAVPTDPAIPTCPSCPTYPTLRILPSGGCVLATLSCGFLQF